MIKYDASVIQTFAHDLYRRADTIIMVNALIFGVVGGAAGLFAFGKLGAILCAIGGGGIGYYFGAQKAFVLKLQAQTALCQAQIERNTQPDSRPSASNDLPSLIPDMRPAPQQPAMVPAVPQGPMGVCPSCDSRIAMAAEKCPKCKASFSAGSPWQVKPE